MNKRDKKRRKDLIRTRRRAITRKRVKKKPKDRPGKSHLPAGGVPQDVRRSPGDARLVERLKPGNTADIMKRIEERLETFRKSDFAGRGQMLKKALKYAIGVWPAMKRVLECGDVELSNNLSEQMMRRIKMNLKNACNIGSEISAKHNAFMFSVIESCKMIKRNVEDYLKALFRRLRTAMEDEDLTWCLPCYMSF